MNTMNPANSVQSSIGSCGQDRWWMGGWRRAAYCRRLRRAVIRTEARFNQMYLEWQTLLFDRHFLLHGGMPIIQRHIAHPAFNDAMDLALAWADQWPAMSENERKAYLQALTLVAAEFLRLLDIEPVQFDGTAARQEQDSDNNRRRIGIPMEYVLANR